MWWPVPANKTPRFFQPCPGNDENNLNPGMYGITDVSAGSEAWYRPFRNNSGDTPAAPIRIATATELAAYLSGSVFDANTILKADTDDTPVALPVAASTIVGRASTGNIAALTASQVATILNGLVTPDDHASTHETGGSDDINPAKLSGNTSAVGDKLSIGDGAITGSTDALEVEQRDLTEIRSKAHGLTSFNSYISVCYNYVAEGTSSGSAVRLYDRMTMSLLAIANGGSNSPIQLLGCEKLVVVGSTALRIFDVSSMDYTDVAGTFGSVYDVCADKNDNIYFINSAGDYFVRDSAGASLSSGTLSGLTNVVCAISIDADGEYIYLLDAPFSSAGTVIVRKYDVATFTLQDSLSLTTSVLGEKYSVISVESDDYLCVAYTAGNGSSTARMYSAIVNTGLSSEDLFSVYITTYKGDVFDGIFYGVNSTQLIAYQTPGLTDTFPKFLDGRALEGSSFRHPDFGYQSHIDWMRAAKQISDIIVNGLQKRVRTVTATGDIEASDMGNIVYVPNTITADVFFTLSTEAAAMEGYSFSIAVQRNATYEVKIGITGAGVFGWDLTGATTSQDFYPRQFLFTIINGNPVPVSTPNALNIPA